MSTAPCITGASESEPMRIRTLIWFMSGCQRLSSDVVPIVHAVERDLRDARIRALDRVLVGGAAADDRQHAAAGGDDVVAAPRRARRGTRARPARAPADAVREIGSPVGPGRRDSRARRARRRRAARAGTRSGAPSSAPSAAAARRGARSSAIIGITTCASGSPNRTLNSITFGPSQVSISPAYRNPRYSCPRRAARPRPDRRSRA